MNNTTGIPAEVMVEIIKEEMGLANDRVWIRNQDKVIPNDTALFVVVGFSTGIPMSNTTYMKQETIDPVPDPPLPPTRQIEVNEVQNQENIQIDICSRDNSALTRQWEIIAAMQSFYSQQQQEKYNFKIFRLPRTMIDTSSAEGGSFVNRYSITFPVFVWYRKTKILTEDGGDYYDDFHQRVDDSHTIGTDQPLFEFEIMGETIT